jgi:hypothetical protein
MTQLTARFTHLIALRFPELKRLALFLENLQMKVARFTVLQPGCLYPQEIYPDTHLYYRLSRPKGQSAAGRFKSMKNTNEIFGNPARDPPASSATACPINLAMTLN